MKNEKQTSRQSVFTSLFALMREKNTFTGRSKASFKQPIYLCCPNEPQTILLLKPNLCAIGLAMIMAMLACWNANQRQIH